MFTMIAPTQFVYKTESTVISSEEYVKEIYKKYGVVVSKENINTNKFLSVDYISNKESSTNMYNNNLYKELDVLSSNDSNTVLYLNFPISFKIEADENGFYYISEKYNLYVYGKTQDEAENNLLEAFKDQFEAFCFEEDVHLDKNAQILKKNLLEVYKYAKKKN